MSTILKEKLDYLKNNIAPLIRVNPPLHWPDMNLYIVGDGIVDLEFEGLRVHVVKENIPAVIAFGALILSEADAEDLQWDEETKHWWYD